MVSKISKAVTQSLDGQNKNKPLAIILAGHNGAGKSTLWYEHIADELQIPLVNADRMMLSILPEKNQRNRLRSWAQSLRDNNNLWMEIAQKGVEAFVAQAMGKRAAFAVETVFSYWDIQPDGTVKSKINLIESLQDAGYFVLLMFVGLSNVNLSVGRVQTRAIEGGHNVDFNKLLERFPRTQHAVGNALNVADAAILFDNSRSTNLAFTPVQIRAKQKIIYDIRHEKRKARVITNWLDIVAPLK